MSSDSSSSAYYKDTLTIQQPPIIQQKALSRREKWIPVIYACLLIAVGQTGMSLLLPALPAMQQDLHVSSQMTQWLVSAYLLGFGPSQLFYGPLSDMYGRRPVLLLSLLGTGIDYIFMALASSLPVLFIGRFISGFTGASYTVATAYIADISDDSNRSKNFGLICAATQTLF
jgi:DHA1 family tetracycline resistance protein-like MFS transporter